jgi:hypothetical protein
MKNCENCGILHFVDYGSGRFCSSFCSRSFSTKNKRSEINEKLRKKFSLKIKEKICLKCGKKYEFKRDRKTQKYCSRSCNSSEVNKGKKISDETKTKISDSVKNSYIKGKSVSGGRTKWYQYKDIKVQGSFEIRTCIILDKLKEIKEIYDWEYTKDRITYIGEDGKIHTYIIDFKVFYSETNFYYLETKGYLTNKDVIKWEHTRKTNRLDVWFYRDIFEKEKELNLIWDKNIWVS